MIEKEKIAQQIVEAIQENDLFLRHLEYEFDECSNKESLELLLKEFSLVELDQDKDDSQCIETTVYHFKDYDLFLKEERIGPCHYRDVMIDGYPDETNFYICEPIQVTAYKSVSQI